LEAAEAIALLFGLMIIGSLFRRSFYDKSWFQPFSKGLIDFVYWILVPLTFIENFSRSGVSRDLVIPLISSVLLIAIVWSAVRSSHCIADKNIEKGVILNSTIQNNLFVGFPVLYSLFGDATMSLYFGFIAFIFAVLLPDIMGRGRFTAEALVKNPVIIGMILGSSVHYAFGQISSYISSLLFWAPSALSYISIFATGLALQMNTEPIKKNLKAFLISFAFKFALNPAVNLLLLSLFSIPPLYRNEIIILSFMPPASFNTVMAMKYGWNPEFVASSSFAMTVISLIAVMFIYHLL